MGVILVAKFCRLDHGYSLPLHNINSCLIQYTFMPPLEVMGPGGGLSMLLSLHLRGGMPAESSLAGGNGDGGIQLRPDNGGTSSSAGGGWQRHGSGGFCTALDSKLCVFDIRASFVNHSIRPFSYTNFTVIGQ